MSDLEQESQLRQSIQTLAESIAQKTAEHTADATVKRMFTLLGIDTDNPLQSQVEFQALRALAKLLKDEGITEDFAFIRRLRTASETIKDTTWKTLVRVGVTALLGLFAIGTKDWWLQHIGFFK